MIFLLVNDDGIKAKRLEYTKSILSKYGKVYTVAPKLEQSGKSMSITLSKIPYEKLDDYTYAVDGTPVDCVSFAIFGLKLKPDYVISGINEGFNIGVDTVYSGTVGAAFQAHYYGYKTIAFSGDAKGTENVKKYFESTLKYLFANNVSSKDHVVNVNFPKEKFSEEAKISFTEPYFVKMRLVANVMESSFYTYREILEDEIPENSDVYALRHGNISISKLYLSR